jgi:hypothetical protein
MGEEGGGVSIDVVNLLKFGWEVIKDSEPVLNITNDRANAVPDGSNWVTDLTGARGPNRSPFNFSIRNDFLYESWPVVCEGSVCWNHSARYRGGGAFIPNAWIEVTRCNVEGLGRSLNVTASVGNPENRGTETAPNAYLPLTLTFQFENPLKDITEQRFFGLYGSGHRD